MRYQARVLVIDDEIELMNVIVEALETRGFKVTWADIRNRRPGDAVPAEIRPLAGRYDDTGDERNRTLKKGL